MDEIVQARRDDLAIRPLGHPDHAHSLSELAIVLRNRYDRMGSQDDLTESIGLLRESLKLLLPGHPNRDSSLSNLASNLGIRYRRTGSNEDLAESIRLNREALELYPPDHPLHHSSLSNLASALLDRYKSTGLDDDIAESIRLNRKALELCPPGHPLRDLSLNNLAAVLRDQYRRTGSEDDLSESISVCRESLELCPRHDMSVENLAIALRDRYSRTGSEDDLTESIRLHREALELRPPNHPHRDISLNNLATVLGDRYDRLGSEVDLAESIQLHTESLQLRPPGHPLRDICLNNLAAMLGDRYKRTSSEDDLAESIRLLREALKLRPPGHPFRSSSLNNLANALGDQYNITGSEDSLAERIRLLREFLELYPPNHPHHGPSLNNLAVALGDQYNITGSEDSLAERIHLLRELLKLCPPNHPHRGPSLNNLAVALSDQYSITGSEDSFAERIYLLREFLKLCPPNHPHHGPSLINLAAALYDQYRITGSEESLAEGTRLLRECVKLLPPHHSLRGTALVFLAAAVSEIYYRTGSKDDLAETFQLSVAALELHPPGHATRLVSLHTLANVLRNRYMHTSSEHDLAESIRLHREVVELCSPDHPGRHTYLTTLAEAIYQRYNCTSSEDDLAESIQLLRNVLELCPSGHPSHAAALTLLPDVLWPLARNSLSIQDELFRLLKEGSVDRISPAIQSLKCSHLWVSRAREVQHNTLGDAYDHLTQSLRWYLTVGPTIKLQYEALTRQAALLSLPMEAAAHFVENGKVGRAVEILDQGRSLLWSEMRRFREQFKSHPPDLVSDTLATRFTATCSELQRISTAEVTYETVLSNGRLRDAEAGSLSAGIPYDELLNRKRKMLQEYDEVLSLIREKPGLEGFLQSLPFEKLQEAANEGPVIIVNCSKFNSHVFIVLANRFPSVITLDADFYNKAIGIHKQYIGALHVTNGARDASRAFGYKLAPIAVQLWDLVVHKVVEELERVGVPKGSRIWWCPTSALTALPLHAAGDGTHYLIDSYISSYTPTLKALIDAREPAPQSTMRGSEAHPRLLAVAQTIDSGLESAGGELDNMRSLGPWVDILDGSEATRQSVLESLPDHNWVHFICHGMLSESGDPFDSALHLHGDTLSLNDIIKARLPEAQFAFLAACHTAEQGRGPGFVLLDEVLHLAGAMQFSGFRSVVGTMWEMEDQDGPKVAKLFYAEMLKDDFDPSQRHTRAARAIWEVTRRMKAKAVSIGRWANFVHIGA